MHPETLHLLNTLTLLSLSSDSPEKHKSDALSPSPTRSECQEAQNSPVQNMPPAAIDDSKNFLREMPKASQKVTETTAEHDCICKYMSLHTRSELGVCLDCLNPHNGSKRVRSTALFNSSMLARKFDRIISKREFTAKSHANSTSSRAEATADEGKIPDEHYLTQKDMEPPARSIGEAGRAEMALGVMGVSVLAVSLGQV